MLISVLQGKIHRATVTDAQLHYEGSITIDTRLMDASGLLPHQAVHIYNISHGSRFETYALPGEYGSGVIQINGAAAHLAQINDLIIIAFYAQMTPEEATVHQPRVVFVDQHNTPSLSKPALLPV
jgi:aspartate 1-decarboxylase